MIHIETKRILFFSIFLSKNILQNINVSIFVLTLQSQGTSGYILNVRKT